jgi:ketosteroid isomerase-like protein
MSSTNAGSMTDEEEIVQLFKDGDRALMSADVVELQRIYADDYQQYDESGRVITKADMIHDLTSGTTRLLSMTATGRRVRLFGEFAIVHGSEEDEIERDGQRFSVRYLYMDVVVRRDGRWQIVASQLVKI